jgi:hypothetical protein
MMQDESYHPLGHLVDTEVGVQPTIDGQDILIQHGAIGQRLACLLAPVAAEMDRRDGTLYWRIAHDPEVDRLLTELIDLFISIRYSHPTLVQLELDLEEAAP